VNIAAFDLAIINHGWARSLDDYGVFLARGRGPAAIASTLAGVAKVAARADLIVLEGYAYGRGQKAHQMGETRGPVKLWLHQTRRPFVEVPPSVVKKVATGRGNAPKREVLAEAVRRLGYGGHDENEADALWLWACAAVAYGLEGAPELPRVQREAAGAVSWPRLDSLTL